MDLAASPCQENVGERSASKPMSGCSGAIFSGKQKCRFLLFARQNPPSFAAPPDDDGASDGFAASDAASDDGYGSDCGASLVHSDGSDDESRGSVDDGEEDLAAPAVDGVGVGAGGGNPQVDAPGALASGGMPAAAPAPDDGAPVGVQGGGGAQPAAPPVPAVDEWDGWYVPRVDNHTGKVPLKSTPRTRFHCKSLPAVLAAEPGPGTPLAMFRLLWSDRVLQLIIENTNARMSDLAGVNLLTKSDLLIWIALTMAMGVCVQPTLASYWSTEHFGKPRTCVIHLARWPDVVVWCNMHVVRLRLLAATTNFAFKLVMARDRYRQIKRFLSVAADRIITPDVKAAPDFDRLVLCVRGLYRCTLLIALLYVSMPRHDSAVPAHVSRG